jgi:very-short-patch-repair endonuclease
LLDEAEHGGVVPDAWFERLLERCVRSPQLPALHRQHVVRDGIGRFVARLDAAMPDIRLGLEAHSRRFHMGSRAEASDEGRDLRLAALGWEVLYVGWQRTKEPAALLEVVLAVARGREVRLQDASSGRLPPEFERSGR